MTDRRAIEDAILAWRDGASFDARHPLAGLPSGQVSIFWDSSAMKDLARVIRAVLDGEPLERHDLPWRYHEEER